jgi:hypothetical protein
MGSPGRRALVLGALALAAGLSLAAAQEPQDKEFVGPPAPEFVGPPAPALADADFVGPPEPATVEEEKIPFGPAATLLDDRAMSARIDELIAAKWAAEHVTPAPPADDAEFFRRLSLDLNGRIPTITQLKDFLDDTHPDKKRIWTRLLMGEAVSVPGEESPRKGDENVDLYVNHWTTFWRTLINSQATNQQLIQFGGQQVDPFLRNFVKENKPYDQMVRELLTGQQGNVFRQALENKSESIAGATSRLFLGTKLECAQCHDDRSGGSWTRTQFWQYAAFFANPNGSNAQITIPDKKQVVQARFLDGTSPQWRSGANSMTILSEWMTGPNNEYFAKAIVNRMWHYLMGVGFVDPVDAASDANPASHPELLDELARQFVAHRFDMKWLVRSIVGSKTYQLTSAKTHESQDNPRLFARMNVRGMSPEQLFDSIAEATGYAGNGRAGRGFDEFGRPINARNEFIQKFNNQNEKRTERQTSILQALYLMNGSHTEEVLKNSKSLRTVQENVQGGTRRNLEELFIVTLSRKPRADELERLSKYVDGGGATNDRKDALADVFWALLLSGEFMLNH